MPPHTGARRFIGCLVSILVLITLGAWAAFQAYADCKIGSVGPCLGWLALVLAIIIFGGLGLFGLYGYLLETSSEPSEWAKQYRSLRS